MITTIRARIVQDDSFPESPREWEPLGVMFCQHRRYTLGDKDAIDPRTIPAEDIAVQLDLYLYDHSGVTMSTTSFHDRWDSGQVGVIYLTVEKLVKEYGSDTPENRAKAITALQDEVEVYDQFIRGDVWGYIIEHVSTCDCCGAEKAAGDGSCFGFYGSNPEENGMFDHVTNEAEQAALKEAYAKL